MITLFYRTQLIDLLKNDTNTLVDVNDKTNQLIIFNIVNHLSDKQLLWLAFYNPTFGLGNDRSIQLNKILNGIYSIFKHQESIQKYKSMFGLHIMYVQYSIQAIIKKNTIKYWFDKIRNPYRIYALMDSTVHSNHYLYQFPKELFFFIYQYL